MKYFSQFVGLAAFSAMVAASVQGCTPAASAEPPLRARARALVIAISEGVKALDQACSEVARARADVALADRCAGAYRTGRASLLLAEASLDVADTTSAACAAAPGLVALHELAEAVRSVGKTVPPVAEDGLELATAFGRLVTCDATDGGSK